MDWKQKEEKKSQQNNIEIIDDINYQCNFFGLRLPFLQIFGNAAGFTAIYSVSALFTQTLSSYISSQIPTLEKQFGLSSYESGIIMTFNDIGFLACILLVSAIPRLVHIPRWLFGTMFLFSVSALLCSLPHFLFPTESPKLDLAMSSNNMTGSLTGSKSNFILCSEELERNNSIPGMERKSGSRMLNSVDSSMKNISIALIGLGMILQGIAKAPRGPFTTVYLDDGCDKRKTGFYFGIIIGCSIFGPALSFGIGGVFSRIYVTLEDVDMSPKDPRWIGAWWLGFVVFGIMTLVSALPVLCLPRYLADKKSKNYEDKIKHTDKSEDSTMTKKEKFKERATSYIRVIKSPVFMCTLLASLFNFSAIIGKIVFLSKYIAAQFGVPLWKANITVSAANLITVSIGTILGGIITRKVEMSPRRCFQINTVLFLVPFLFFISELFLGCKQPEIFGFNSHMAKAENISSVCNCNPQEYFPVCGTNDVTYFSPCYAGCSDTVRNGRLFVNCTQITSGQATAGLCPFDCNTFYPFIIVNVIGSFIGALSIMPMVIAKMRSVEDRDKATGMGLQSTVVSLLAAIPIPIIFGKIIDTTCLIWSSGHNTKGACALYNIENLRFRMVGTAIMYKFVALGFTLLALKLVWNINDWGDLWKGKSLRKNEDEVKLVVSANGHDANKGRQNEDK
ncbi:solute carrier organic anion transporter family member 2A1-like [Mytilus galloprovincialis]|uniref:solute carrier organic anion transporter family member 2A1-like n=1 Tax=Mytilus galloprovincialis TaxID=29158 RepID=UPI003F7C5EA6